MLSKIKCTYLKCYGFFDRDDNNFLKSLIAQFKNASVDSLFSDRISFLVEDLQTIKNAKLAKFTDKFDRSFLEHYQKVLKGLTKRKSFDWV